MNTPFIRYRDFYEASELVEFIQLLKSHNIEFETEGSTISILQDDLSKVNALTNADAANLLDTVDQNYHLFKLDNQKLLEIITNADKWSAFDYQVAKSILNSRGVHEHKGPEWSRVVVGVIMVFFAWLMFYYLFL